MAVHLDKQPGAATKVADIADGESLGLGQPEAQDIDELGLADDAQSAGEVTAHLQCRRRERGSRREWRLHRRGADLGKALAKIQLERITDAPTILKIRGPAHPTYAASRAGVERAGTPSKRQAFDLIQIGEPERGYLVEDLSAVHEHQTDVLPSQLRP